LGISCACLYLIHLLKGITRMINQEKASSQDAGYNFLIKEKSVLEQKLARINDILANFRSRHQRIGKIDYLIQRDGFNIGLSNEKKTLIAFIEKSAAGYKLNVQLCDSLKKELCKLDDEVWEMQYGRSESKLDSEGFLIF
jgi:hypothetical protein